MAFKFGRNYRLAVTPNTISNPGASPAPVIIQPPFTIEIDVCRGRQGSFNNANIRIYNLAPQTRNLLLKDWQQLNTGRTVTLNAGYGTGKLPLLFYGQLFEAHSRRDGVDFITNLTAQASGDTPNVFYNGPPFNKGTARRVVIQALVDNMAAQIGLSRGTIGQFDKPLGAVYIPSLQLKEEINELSGGKFWADNNLIHVIGQNEHIPTPSPILIDSSMGLLETPTVNFKSLTFPILFEPSIFPGGLINLQSTTIESAENPYEGLKSYNGIQLVQNVHHSGVISDVVSGDLRTDVSIQIGAPLTQV